MVQHWNVMQKILGSIMLGIISISSSEKLLIYCQMLHSDMPFIAQFHQVSHLHPRWCKCQIKH